MFIIDTKEARDKVAELCTRFFDLAKFFLIPSMLMAENASELLKPENKKSDTVEASITEFENEFFTETKPVIVWYIPRLIELFMQGVFDVS